MPLVAAGRQGYRNSLCFQGCLRRSTDSHVLRATWHGLLDGFEIGWTKKPVWMWPEPLTPVMVLCSDMTIVWVGTAFDMDSESPWTDASHTNRKNEATVVQGQEFTYGLKGIVHPKMKTHPCDMLLLPWSRIFFLKDLLTNHCTAFSYMM